MGSSPWLLTSLVLALVSFREAVCVPATGCESAYAFYRIRSGENLTAIGQKFQTTPERIQDVNPNIVDANFINYGDPLFIPFKCDCVNDQLLHNFQYMVTGADTLDSITATTYQNLSQNSWVMAASHISDANFITSGQYLTIPVNCSCGNPTVSSGHYIFLTYVVEGGTGGNLSGVASQFNSSVDLVRSFNPGVIWDNSQPTYVHISMPSSHCQIQIIMLRTVAQVSGAPLNPSLTSSSDSGKSTSTGVIAGAAVGGIVVLCAVLALALYYLCIYRPKKKQRYADALSSKSGRHYSATASDLLNMHSPSAKTGSNPGSASFGPTGLADYTVDKSVEFTYEELANATDNFSIANKIGQGGFAVVFYGVIRGQKLAIKRMNLQSTKEFRAELQVLSHVHHTNLSFTSSIYQQGNSCDLFDCTCSADWILHHHHLFLVYEFVENGTLDFHLHSARAAREPLSWSLRVQIALDAARGLEYIHEHTRPSYIHRDIKSANILLDEQFHAKVADFGLTKLTATKVEDSGTKPTNVVGTWGYMAPEYARFGDVSPMLDVYAFGIVLLEILSGKEAIIRGALTEDMAPSIGRPMEEQRALVHYFEPLLKGANGRDKLPKFMDPALGDNYPSDAAWKMTQLAAACTHELPSNRPTMRKAVLSLMTLSSTTHEWEVGAFANHSGTTRSG